jgi:hypothetical protein
MAFWIIAIFQFPPPPMELNTDAAQPIAKASIVLVDTGFAFLDLSKPPNPFTDCIK